MFICLRPDRRSFANASVNEDGRIPAIHRQVALTAFGGKSVRLMVGCGRLAKCVQMATHALRGEAETIELPDSPNLMA